MWGNDGTCVMVHLIVFSADMCVVVFLVVCVVYIVTCMMVFVWVSGSICVMESVIVVVCVCVFETLA